MPPRSSSASTTSSTGRRSKFAPDTLIGLLLPKEVRAKLTDKERDFIVENAYMAGLPISERTEGIAFDNEQSNPVVTDFPSSD